MAKSDDPETWLEVDMCLMNGMDYEKKIAGELATDKVNLVHMKIKLDIGCSELALPKCMVQQLKLNYYDPVKVSSSTDNDIPIERYGPVIIHWDGIIYRGVTYCMPSLDSALLGLKPLYSMKPDIDWFTRSLKRSIFTLPFKRYQINFNDIEKVIGSDDKIDYFTKDHNVKIHLTNALGSKMLLTICAMRFDVDLDKVAETVSHFAPSLTPI